MNRRACLGALASGVGTLSGCSLFSGPDEPDTDQPRVLCGPDGVETTTPAQESSIAGVEGAWPTTYFDAQLTAANPGATPPRDCPRLQWRTRVEFQQDRSSAGPWSDKPSLRGSPAVADGDCYVVDNEDEFYAFEASTGAERWRASLDRDGSPGITVADGVAYFGNGASVRAISLADRGELWHATPSRSELLEGYGAARFRLTSAPTVAAGLVVVGTQGGLVQAFGAQSGREVWRHDVIEDVPGPVQWDGDNGPIGPAVPAPAIAAETVYVGDETGAVTALELATGTVEWRVQLDTPVDGGLAVADDGLFVVTQTECYRLDPANGTIQWQLSETLAEPVATTTGTDDVTGGIHVLGSPAVDTSGTLYLFAAPRGKTRQLRAVDAATGAITWTADVGSTSIGAISVGDTVVLANTGQFTVAVDRDDGTVLWGIEAPLATDTCALVDNVVFMSDLAGYCYAFA